MTAETIWAQCPACKGNRHCEVLCEKRRTHKNEGHPEEWFCYEMLRCMGCNNIFFRRRLHFGDFDEDGNQIIKENIYPPTNIRPTRQRFDSYTIFYSDNRIETLQNEIHSAISNNLPSLAAMGTRALFEVVAVVLTGVQDERFGERIVRLVRDGWVPERQSELLNIALELGHATIHRGHIPKIEDVHVALDIIEQLIVTYIYNQEKAKALQGTIPKRTKKR